MVLDAILRKTYEVVTLPHNHGIQLFLPLKYNCGDSIANVHLALWV